MIHYLIYNSRHKTVECLKTFDDVHHRLVNHATKTILDVNKIVSLDPKTFGEINGCEITVDGWDLKLPVHQSSIHVNELITLVREDADVVESRGMCKVEDEFYDALVIAARLAQNAFKSPEDAEMTRKSLNNIRNTLMAQVFKRDTWGFEGDPFEID